MKGLTLRVYIYYAVHVYLTYLSVFSEERFIFALCGKMSSLCDQLQSSTNMEYQWTFLAVILIRATVNNLYVVLAMLPPSHIVLFLLGSCRACSS